MKTRHYYDETTRWIEIKNQEGIQYMWDCFGGFDLARISKASFTRGINWINQNTQKTEHDGDVLTIEFDRTGLFPIKSYGITPIAKRIEIVFSGLKRLNFVPIDVNGLDQIYGANMTISNDGLIYWNTIVPYMDENRFNDKSTWVCCEKVRWRMIDYYEEIVID